MSYIETLKTIFNEIILNIFNKISDNLPQIILSIIIITLFYIISNFAKYFIIKILKKYLSNITLVHLIGTILKLLIIIAGFILALNVLNLSTAVTSVLTGLGIIGIIIGFAFQDIAANFFAGMILSVKKPLQINDIIEINGIFGKIRKIELRSSELITPQGQHVEIPNRILFENPLINYSTEKKRRIDLNIGVSYSSDLEKVKKVTLETIKKIKPVLKDKPIQFFYEEFGDSSINFVVRFWVDFKNQPDYLEPRSNAIIAIKKAFDKENINIPFPIRTINFSNNLKIKK